MSQDWPSAIQGLVISLRSGITPKVVGIDQSLLICAHRIRRDLHVEAFVEGGLHLPRLQGGAAGAGRYGAAGCAYTVTCTTCAEMPPMKRAPFYLFAEMVLIGS